MRDMNTNHTPDLHPALDSSDDALFQDDTSALGVSSDKQVVFENTLKQVLPHLGTDEVKIIVTQVMIALKLEGILGVELTPRDKKMVNVIKESILVEPAKKREALRLAQKLLG